MSGRVAAIAAGRRRPASRPRLRRRRDRRRLEVGRRRAHLAAGVRRPAGGVDRRRWPSTRSNPTMVWVGTGEGNPRNSVSVGNGVYRSLDGGRTWKHLGLGEDRAHPPHRPPPARPRHRLGGGARPGLGREPRARRLQDRRRRQDLAAGALRRRADRRRRPGDRPANPNKLFAAHVGLPALAVVLPLGRPGLRPLRHPRRRRDLEAAAPRRTACPRATSAASASPSRAPTRASSTPWSRPRRTPCCAPTDGGRTWQTVNDRDDVSPRPFYYADIRVDPGRPEPRLPPGLDRRRLDRRRQDASRRLAGFARRPPRPPRDVDRPRRPRATSSRATTAGSTSAATAAPPGASSANLPLAQFYHVRSTTRRPTTSTAACRTTAPGGARARSGRTAASATTTGRRWCFGDGFDTAPDPRDPMQGYAMSQEGFLIALEPAHRRAQGHPARRRPRASGCASTGTPALALDPFEPGHDLLRQPVPPQVDATAATPGRRSAPT